ncbi:HlyD family efflux transporter periplasmic adaptor subunit [Agrobacterium tumefaciens]|nr:HlyD family efflux transporter periplasmic adaptor subunit [Agrobacterium tumefaciens]NTD99539.1 HlyD family efflux transporter periplasmic adaptor subunit [Agrobacterium tumefaciens]NTE20592.1 HlyD family efflux transporter periplasmic adaptor subunit [Agrobacterium tumefaciens]NTE20599.1 HlyD family efflux transporter periplasmic adaptor subunit [Agrobacterium tumefaciens]
MSGSICRSHFKKYFAKIWRSCPGYNLLLDRLHSNKIYRTAAVLARQSRFSNPINIVGSVSATTSAALIIFVTSALFVYAFTATYTRKYIVSGVLEAEGGSVAVYSPFDGQLSIDVANGQLVSVGQRLGLVQANVVSAGGASAIVQEIETINDSIEIATKRINLLSEQMNTYEQQYITETKRNDSDLENLLEQRVSKKKQLEYIREDLIINEKLLANNIIKKDVVIEKKEKLAILAQEISLLNMKIKDYPLNKQRIFQDWRVKSISLSQEESLYKKELLSLRGNLSALQTKQFSGIFSPIGGNVVFSRAQNAQVATSGTPLFRISPAEAKLIAKVFVPSSAVGFLNVGDEIGIRYSAFSYREHGVFSARVTSLDRISQSPGSIEAPFSLTEPVYVVKAEIDQIPISKKNKPLNLLPGMTFEATVNIDKKLIIMWLLGPIF